MSTKPVTMTVGDLIDVLSKYDRNKPVLKSDPDRNGYLAIHLLPSNYIVCVSPSEERGDFIDYMPPFNVWPVPEHFEAIVL
jgi:hypothetical protein